jgi:hypothetical protein
VTLGVPQGSHLGPLSFIWFVNRISMTFEYVCVLFYAIDMKLFLPVKSFQDCMKIQSDLNKLSEWCERNSLFKMIAFSRTHYTVEFFYMLGGTVLDRVSSINDLGVNMDERMNFSDHIDVMKKTVIRVQRPIHSALRSLYTSLVRPKLKYASCVYGAQYMTFVWTRLNVCRKGLSDMLCVVWVGRIFTICYRMSIGVLFRWDSEFLRISFHRTNYGVHEPMYAAMREFNEVISLFDFILTRKHLYEYLAPFHFEGTKYIFFSF